jgi:transglutaminase/protease-like cytokinesis protein 3
MYTNQTCYSRVEAVLGAQIVKEYSQGSAVEIVATTDTGYCKLSDGTFIHSDYLSTSNQGGAGTTAAYSTAVQIATTTAAQTGSVISSVSNNASYENRYFWNQLNSDEQKLYADIVSAAENYYTGIINVPAGADGKKIYTIVFNNEPRLFWLNTTVSTFSSSMSLKYSVSKEEIPTIQSEIDANVKKIMNTASGASNLNKIKVFYDWIVLNNEFHLDDSAANCSIENGLRPGSGYIQCLGYARTMQYLCDVAGIPCVTIPGESIRGASHAWNKLQLSGKWYNIDATRGDPINDYNSKYISYAYYLVPDSWIASSHLNENQIKFASGSEYHLFNTPSASDSSLNYFKLYNKEFSTTDTAWNGICAEIKRALNNGANTAHIRVTTNDIYDTLTSKSYWRAAQDYARTITPGVDLLLQTTDLEGVKVVQYNINY